MLSKAWRSLVARFTSKPQGQLRFWVHRDPKYQSFWQPIARHDQQPRLQIQVYLEASNLGAAACWIVAAVLADVPAIQTVIGVRDASTRKFAPDNPLPPRQLTTVSLQFLVNGQSVSSHEPFRGTLVLTEQAGGRHFIKVVMH